jgi:hypothetical protein
MKAVPVGDHYATMANTADQIGARLSAKAEAPTEQ